jgi:hypothetical protein
LEEINGALDKGILISPEELNEERLIAICRRELANSSFPLSKVVILTDSRQRFDLLERTHMPFDIWQRRAETAAVNSIYAAELIAIRGNAVLRVRDGLRIRRIVIVGSDPLVYGSADAPVEILHIAIAKRVTPIQVFMKSKRMLPHAAAVGLGSELERKLSARVYLVIRTDPWFFLEPGFPSPYWFNTSVPPALPVIAASASISCSRIGSRELTCRSKQFSIE